MTVTHAGPMLPAANVEDAVELVRARGLRVSAARRLVIDARPAILAAAHDAAAGVSPATAAARFHNGLAEVTARACAHCAERRGIDVAVLSGGVFQNRLLLERTAAALAGAGLEVLVPERLPPNDGGIAYGQAAVAARAIGAG